MTFSPLARTLLMVFVLLYSLSLLTYLVLSKQPAEATIVMAAGCLFLIFLNLDRFKTFEALGVKAEIVDLKEAVAEGQSVIAQLNALAEIQGRFVLTSLLHNGLGINWSMGLTDPQQLLDEIRNLRQLLLIDLPKLSGKSKEAIISETDLDNQIVREFNLKFKGSIIFAGVDPDTLSYREGANHGGVRQQIWEDITHRRWSDAIVKQEELRAYRKDAPRQSELEFSESVRAYQRTLEGLEGLLERQILKPEGFLG